MNWITQFRSTLRYQRVGPAEADWSQPLTFGHLDDRIRMQESVMSDAIGIAKQETDLTFIPPVPPPTLSKASGKGCMDESSKQIREVVSRMWWK